MAIYVGSNEFHQARKLLTEGKRLSAIREYEAAIKVLKQVIESKPDSADAWYELAKIHHKQGHSEEREACIVQVVALKPEWKGFTEKLRASPIEKEEMKSAEDTSLRTREEVIEDPSFPYPYEMLDALVSSVLKDLYLRCAQGPSDEPFLLPNSGFDSEDAIRILTLAAAKGRQEEAYTGLVAYLRLRPKDEATWKILMFLAEKMNIEKSVNIAKEALEHLEKDEALPNDIWDELPTVEIPISAHTDSES